MEITKEIQEENIKKFESLMNQVERKGAKELVEWLKTKTDFYTAPASTRFHMSCPGGLLQHSLNVYECLKDKRSSKVLEPYLKDVSDESLIIMGLLHDICKIRTYEQDWKNEKCRDEEVLKNTEMTQIKHDNKGNFIWRSIPIYKVEDEMPLGHGEKSVILLLSRGLKLNQTEIYAIRWHMGFSEPKEYWGHMDAAIKKCKLALILQEADYEATKIWEECDE